MLIHVRVIPRSARNTLVWEQDTLKARLTAAPVDGAANAALITLLADRLALPKRAITIVRGSTGRQKTLSIEGLSLPEIVQKLQG